MLRLTGTIDRKWLRACRQLPLCWDSAAALRAGHGVEAELVVLSPALTASTGNYQAT